MLLNAVPRRPSSEGLLPPHSQPVAFQSSRANFLRALGAGH